jgi:pyruvate/2-oxoglutarate/acetoin dehydrogenase E1 component
MGVITFAEASRRALAAQMRRDPTIWVLGEDVRQGGVFGQYKGLLDEFGPSRIVDTPIAEATIMGAGLGAALVGTRPVIEMRIADFVMPAMDELVNQIAKVRYMFGGQGRARVLVRMPHGLLPGSAAQHSQTIENWFVNLPGVVVATPATAADLAGTITTALTCDDPVLLFEPKAFWKREEDVDDDAAPLTFGRGAIRRNGRDVTLVTWSQALPHALAAADEAGLRGVGVEVIDLRTLWPWDEEAVAASLLRTGRLLVVQEGVLAGGFGGEVVARMAERLGPELRAVKRIGAPRIPVPFAPTLEAEASLDPRVIADMLIELARR